MKLVTVAEMAAIEKSANANGLSYEAMMENAGIGLGQIVEREFGYQRFGGVLGLVGSGNNGGDTLVALAYLAERGWRASAYIIKKRPEDDPLSLRLTALGGKIFRYEDDPDFRLLKMLVAECHILLDGILGTGFNLPLRGSISEVLHITRQVLENPSDSATVIAVDCPSGVNCDSGEADPEVIPAELTVTMAAVKTGLVKLPAFNLTGRLEVVGIGLPDDLPEWKKVSHHVVEKDWVRKQIPTRPNNAHKGTFGTAMILAGSQNYCGAVYLAGLSAYLAGAGLVTLAIPRSIHAALAGQLVEATWVLLPDEDGFLSKSGVSKFLENLGRATSLLVGPGFGLEKTTQEFIAGILEHNKLPPLIFDADGLKLLSRIAGWESKLPTGSILTPHPGEMAVITGLPIEEIQANRLEICEKFARQWEQVIVLKGAFTVIAEPGGQLAVIPVATSALAKAGTGDILAGLITGLRAQGLPAFESAIVGAWVHAFAGLHQAEEYESTASILASDILNAIPEVYKMLLQTED